MTDKQLQNAQCAVQHVGYSRGFYDHLAGVKKNPYFSDEEWDTELADEWSAGWEESSRSQPLRYALGSSPFSPVNLCSCAAVKRSKESVAWLKLASCATHFGECPAGVEISNAQATVAWFAMGRKPLRAPPPPPL